MTPECALAGRGGGAGGNGPDPHACRPPENNAIGCLRSRKAHCVQVEMEKAADDQTPVKVGLKRKGSGTESAEMEASWPIFRCKPSSINVLPRPIRSSITNDHLAQRTHFIPTTRSMVNSGPRLSRSTAMRNLLHLHLEGPGQAQRPMDDYLRLVTRLVTL